MRIKFFALTYFCFFIFLSAQETQISKSTVISSAWKNESAVILELERQYEAIPGYKDEIILKEKQRKKIVLQDQAALEEFSTIYIPFTEYDNSASDANNFFITVHKKNGETIPLKNSDAIPLQMSHSKSFGWGAYTYMKKMAVPNLETGDVIEYEYTTRSTEQEMYTGTIDIADMYPVQKLLVRFDIAPQYHFTQASVNTNAVLEGGARDRELPRTLGLKLDSVYKWKEELWAYESRTFPRIRFKVEYDPRFKLEKQNSLENNLQEEIASYLFNTTAYKENDHYIKKIKTWLRENRKEVNENSAVNAWYYFRYLVLKDIHDGTLKNSARGNGNKITDELFCAILLQVLNDMDIPAKLICYVPRDKGTPDYALSPWDFDIAIKYAEGEKDGLLFNFTYNSLQTDIPNNSDGVDAYTFSADKSYQDTKFRWWLTLNPTLVVLPAAVYATELTVKELRKKEDLQKEKIKAADAFDNLLYAEYQLDLVTLPQSDSIRVIRFMGKSGNFKNDDNTELISIAHALQEDEQHFGIKPGEKKSGSGYEALYNEEIRKLQEEKRKQYLASELESDDMKILRYNNYRLISTGRFENDPALRFSEDYILTNVYNQPDNTVFIINPGAIIGSQLTLSKNEMVRSYDAYFAYPRAIKNKVTIKIPEGFQALNLNEFQMDVESKTGYFKSTAKQEGNIITIETSKVYLLNTVKKEDWSEMTAWLDAAYHFTQKKMIFRRD